MTKRVFDFITVFVFLPLILPVVVVLSAMLVIKLGKPIIFSQVRPGLAGRPFKMTKFRTMTNLCNADRNLLLDAER